MVEPEEQKKKPRNQLDVSQRLSSSVYTTVHEHREARIAVQDWHATTDGVVTGASQGSEVKLQTTPTSFQEPLVIGQMPRKAASWLDGVSAPENPPVTSLREDPMGDCLQQHQPRREDLIPQSEMKYISAAHILTESQTGTNWKFEGLVVRESIQERSVGSPSKRKAAVEKIVIDCIMVDRTGPVKVSVWDAAATQLQREVQRATNGSRPLLLLQKIRITQMARNEWNGNFVSPMKLLGSVASGEVGEGTSIRTLPAPQSPYNQNVTQYVTPTPPAAVHDFHQLQDYNLPLRGTFVGTVQNCTDLDATSTGQPKKDFDLVDDTGGAFACSVIGPHAKFTKINDNDKVVLYHAVGRRVGQTDAFVVYIFRDGFVVNIGTVNPVPAIRDRVKTRPM